MSKLKLSHPCIPQCAVLHPRILQSVEAPAVGTTFREVLQKFLLFKEPTGYPRAWARVSRRGILPYGPCYRRTSIMVPSLSGKVAQGGKRRGSAFMGTDSGPTLALMWTCAVGFVDGTCNFSRHPATSAATQCSLTDM